MRPARRVKGGYRLLSRIFHSFPGGRTGLGLLLLRAAVGVVVLIQGGSDLTTRPDPTIGTWIEGSLAAATGISLMAGFLTPVAAGLVGIGAVASLISIVPVPHLDLFASNQSVAFLAVVAVSVGILGPGAFSIDARLFGLREIIIPPSRASE